MRFANAVTTVTDIAITNAGLSCAVTANAEQIPRICMVTGLSLSSGPVSSFMFFAENNDSFWLMAIFSFEI
jgi:hypothetical protein